MGRSTGAHLRWDEYPRHRVVLSAFEIDSTPVSYAQFLLFTEKTGYITSAERQGYAMYFEPGLADWKWVVKPGATYHNPFPEEAGINGHSEYPVTNISWLDAVAFCSYHNRRLPTEAEWVYAVSGGNADRRFPWGDTLISNDRYMANVWQGQFTEAGENHRISLDRDGYRYLAPIGMYRANRWGVMGAIGNVWEYTSDWYDPEYFQYLATEYPEGAVNPTGPEHGTLKVGRGGSWWCSDETCRGFGLFYRGHGRPDQSFPNQGFRCARSITE